MKKRKISFFIVLVILLSQFSQTFGAGQVKNNENSAVYAKIKDQKALEEKKKKEEEQAQEKRELDEEKSRILDSENYYSDRFLVKYTGGKKAKAFAKENFAELAYAEAKKEKAAKEKEVKARIKDGEEQEEFSQMLAGWQESGETDKTKFVESAGGYEVIQLAEKIDPETFMEVFLQESGDGEIERGVRTKNWEGVINFVSLNFILGGFRLIGNIRKPSIYKGSWALPTPGLWNKVEGQRHKTIYTTKTGLPRTPKGAGSLCILRTKSTSHYRFITSAVL